MQNNSFADWPALRAALIQRYDRQLTGMEVRTQLARRTKKSDETFQRYVCCILEIARQSECVSEAEIVEAIIYGLRDHSGRAAILDTARTVEELCRLLIRYERRIQHANRANNSATAAARGNSATSTSDRKPKAADKDKTRCFNCSKFGHLSSECKEPKRAPGSCFTCGQKDHSYKNCPKKKTVAVVIDPADHPGLSEDDDDDDAVDVNQQVSVAFSENGASGWTAFNECDSLLDTGSPVSFIRRSKLPAKFQTDEQICSNFRGLGGTKLFTSGKLNCLVNFRGHTDKLNLFVLSDDILPNSMLLGRDFLAKFRVKLIHQRIKSIELNKLVEHTKRQLVNKKENCLSESLPRVRLLSRSISGGIKKSIWFRKRWRKRMGLCELTLFLVKL